MRSRRLPERQDWPPARLTRRASSLLAGCGAGSAIAIDELQLEGKRRMKAREFINGYQPKAGRENGELAYGGLARTKFCL